MQPDNSGDLEAVAATVIGGIMLTLSRLEFNLGLYLRNAVGGQDPDAANPLVARLTLKGKVDALREVVEQKCPAALVELGPWLKAMETFRTRRNSFVHGRWGFAALSQQVVNVAPGLPNGKGQSEVRYSIEELQGELHEARMLAVDFESWSRKWRL